MSTLELTLTKNIQASAEKVFNAWLDPSMLAQFMTPGPGMTVPKAEVDAKEGGKFLIVMKAGEKEIPHSGEYQSIEKYTKLSFTWFSPNAEKGSLVTLTFSEPSPGKTALTLHHTGFETEESRNDHEGGWGSILSALESFAF